MQQHLFRQLAEKARRHAVADLSVQHARLRVREIEAAPGTGDRHVHQSPFLFQAVFLVRALLVRKQAFLQTGDEHGVEFQPLGGVHRHQLQRIAPGLGLVLAGLECGVGQEGVECRFLRLFGEQRGGVDQFVEVFQPVGAFLVGSGSSRRGRKPR
jgi:hypothetical protein